MEEDGLIGTQKITGYLPKDDGAKLAMKDADIVVIPAGIPRKIYTSEDVYKARTDQTALQASQE